MKRRSFVKASLLSGAAATVLPVAADAAEANFQGMGSEFYELKVYQLKNETQQKIVEGYLKDALIPALNRLGVKNIGAFTEMKPAGQTKVFVVIPYSSLLHYSMVNDRLGRDAGHTMKGSAYLNAPATAPAYERIESSLMKAFSHFPKLTPPTQKPRIFELRQYQSASESAGKKKIEMFNNQGEIDIFKRLGFNPVFWGETVIGPQRPNLTYMVTFDDMAAKDAHWKAFGSDPEWKKISAVPAYADALLVSKITSTMLVPTTYSQL